jgi:hypothetical protein
MTRGCHTRDFARVTAQSQVWGPELRQSGLDGSSIPGSGAPTGAHAPVTGVAAVVGLCAGRRAAVAAELLPALEEEARQRQGLRADLERETSGPVGPEVAGAKDAPPWHRARDEAAKAAGASPRSVQRAKKVKERAPDLKTQAAEANAKGQPLRGVREAWTPTSASLLAGLARSAAHSTAQRRAQWCTSCPSCPMSSSATSSASRHGDPPTRVIEAADSKAAHPLPGPIRRRADKESLPFPSSGSGCGSVSG